MSQESMPLDEQDQEINSEEFDAAVEIVRGAPEDEQAWDQLEDLADSMQRPSMVGQLYRDILDENLPTQTGELIANRAVNFHEEWFGDEHDVVIELLEKIVNKNREWEWAFERLTMELTVAERWDDLLDLYDRAIDATDDEYMRGKLLDDAIHVAKDFAGNPDRAITYLKRRLDFDPSNEQIAASIERLAERHEKWDVLIELWRSRISILSAEQANATMARIGACYLDNFSDPGRALVELEILLAKAPGHEEGCRQLERIFAMEEASSDVRSSALGLLRTNYEATGRQADIVAVLENALEFADGQQVIDLHREAASRLSIANKDVEALDHYKALLMISPADTNARTELRQLTKRSGLHEQYAAALTDIAGACEGGEQKAALMMEVAKLRSDSMDDKAGAIELYKQVLDAKEAERDVLLQVAQRLEQLLESDDEAPERLGVLEQIAQLGPLPAVRRHALGEAGLISERLGDDDRALVAWTARLEDEERDFEAMDASVRLLENLERWDDLTALLARRVEIIPIPMQRREDLILLAQINAEKLNNIDAAIDIWLRIQEEFGQDAQVVEALDGLLDSAGRWTQLATLLNEAALSEFVKPIAWFTRLGHILSEHLEEPKTAATKYAKALDVDSSSEEALEGLTALLENEDAAAVACEALVKAYKATGDWNKTLELTEVRLSLCEDYRQKMQVLREATELFEHRAQDAAAALATAVQAFLLDPNDSLAQGDMLRLAEQTEQWEIVCEALVKAVGSVDQSRAAQLHLKRAEILEHRTNDASAAVDAYEAVFEIEGRRMDLLADVVRVASKTRRWNNAARAAVKMSQMVGALDESLIAEMYSKAVEHEQLEALTNEIAQVLMSIEPRTSIARDWELTLAAWYRDCDNADSARAAASRAVVKDPSHLGALELLASLQRDEAGVELMNTLLKIDSLTFGYVNALHEAAQIAVELGNADSARTILEHLYRKALGLGASVSGEIVSWSREQLIDRYIADENRDAAVELLLDSVKTTQDHERRQELRRSAAKLLLEKGDNQRAVVVLQNLLDETPDDIALVRQLAQLCASQGRLPELLSLKKRELELCDEVERRLELRLEINKLLGDMEGHGGRAEVLWANLSDMPGHDITLDALSSVLQARGRYDDLIQLLSGNAEMAESAQENDRAAIIWAQAAEIAQKHLHDADQAIAMYSKSVDLAPGNDALDALARLLLKRKQPVLAADWIKKRLEIARPSEQVAVRLRLARAQLEAMQVDEAIPTLEAAFEDAPRNAEVTKLLFGLYRQGEQWNALVRALSIAAEHVTDPETILGYAKEVAQIVTTKLDSPELAVPVLEHAAKLETQEKYLRGVLAQGLFAAGRHDEARETLTALIEEFGRRRSAERAQLHLKLARVLHAEDQTEAAIDQLETASKMDTSSANILQTLAQMASRSGQLARAERAYRTLLMNLRRRSSDSADQDTVGTSEVMMELSRIARERGENEQAKELIESALEAITQSDEGPRLQKKLAASGEFEMLERVIEKRMTMVDSRRKRAGLLVELADIQAEHLEQPVRAFETRLKALDENPGLPLINDTTLALAIDTDNVDKYQKSLDKLLEQARRGTDNFVRCELLLRLSELLEKGRDDLSGSEEYLKQAEETGVRKVNVLRARARIAGARGDTDEQTRLLEQLTTLGAAAVETRADAMYSLAEIQMADEDGIDEGVDLLKKAFTESANYERAGGIIERAAQQHPHHDELLLLYGRVAHGSGNKQTLLGYLEKRATHPHATPEQVREAVDIANELDEISRAEDLMIHAVEIARELIDGMTRVDWALLGLARRRMEKEDAQGAISWLCEAVDAMEPEQLLESGEEIIVQATQANVDPNMIAMFYEKILERARTQRAAWEPLVEIYRNLGDLDRLERLVAETIDSLEDLTERNTLRLVLAREQLESDADHADNAVEVLRDVLSEEPEHQEGQMLLITYYEKKGEMHEVIDMLRNQMMYAQGSGDSEVIKPVALRLGGVLQEAMDSAEVYRSALEQCTDDPQLLKALIATMTNDEELGEKVKLLERLINTEEDSQEVVRLTLDAASAYQELEDFDAVLRVVDSGYRRVPQDEMLASRVRESYRERGDLMGLAQLISQVVAVQEEPSIKLSLLREAASVYGEAGDVTNRGMLLQAAFEIDDSDPALLMELAQVQEATGDVTGAIEKISILLEQGDDQSLRLEQLRIRARMKLVVGDENGAVEDLEQAYSIDSEVVAQEYQDAMEKCRVAAADRGDKDALRVATMRLVKFVLDADKFEEARELLAGWVSIDADDVEMLRKLADLDLRLEKWPELLMACKRLITLETGEDQIDAAMRITQACDVLDSPDDACEALEYVLSCQPENVFIRDELKPIYLAQKAYKKLAEMARQEVEEASSDEERAALLKQAGKMMQLDQDAAGATEMFKQAIKLDPTDAELTVELIDSLIEGDALDEAEEQIDTVLAAQKERRSPLIAILKYKIAKIEGIRGGVEAQLAMLKDAHATDRANGEILADLADLAERLEQWNLAIKALRNVVLFEGECRISNAEAYLRQGRIWHELGEDKKAKQWVQKARQELGDTEEVMALLAAVE